MLTMNKWQQSLNLVLLELHKKLPKNSMLISMVIRHLRQIVKVKNLLKWLPRELTENQKKSSFWSVVFSYSMQEQCGISQLDYDMWSKVDFYMKTSSVVGPRRSSKALPKAKHATKKKRSWSLFGGLLRVWSTTAFWIPAQTLHLRSILSKSMRCTENCNACSWHWSTEWFQFFSMTTPDCTLHNQRFKSWTNWVTKVCFICHIHLTSRQLITTSSSISAAFRRENASTTSRRQKMLFKNLSNPKAQIFMLE